MPRARIKAALAELSDAEAIALLYDWDGTWARDNQKPPPGSWAIWLAMAGRGFGKTRIGAEWIIDGAKQGMRRMRIVARTAGDIRITCIEGESGILECSPPGFVPKYESSKTKLTWPNGATAYTFAAKEPAKLRGPASPRDWWDEVATYQRGHEVISNAMLGLRTGKNPRACATTTPRPIRLIKKLIAGEYGKCEVTTGSTYDNLENLAGSFRDIILAMEGTSLADQEIRGILLEEAKGALWRRAIIEPNRVKRAPANMPQTAVALDPNVKNNPESDEAGIVWGGRDDRSPPHFYICGDLSSFDGPAEWPRLTVDCWSSNRLDRVVYEANQGGDLVRDALRNHWATLNEAGALPTTEVHSTRGKRIRAEPIVTLYEQQRVHHVGTLTDLEDQLCTWVPGEGDSPGRLDTVVHLVTHLSGGSLALVGPRDMSSTSRHTS